MNNLTKFHEDPLKIEASIVLCTQWFSKIWPSDLVFYPTGPISEIDVDTVKHSDKVSWRPIEKGNFYCVHMAFQRFDLVT